MFGVPSCDELLKISCLKFKLHDKLLIGVQGHVGLEAQACRFPCFKLFKYSSIQLQGAECHV